MIPSHVPGLLGPMLAAVIVTWRTGGRSGTIDLLRRMGRWRVDWRWWMAALSPLAFAAIAFPIVRVVDSAWPDWSSFERMNGLSAAGVASTWALLILLNGYGEETGWRGFAIDRMQRHMTPLAATLILAAFWALWHLPTFFFVSGFEDFGLPMLAAFFFSMACGAVVLTWLYNRSGRSILIVAVWHGTYNIVSGSAAAEGVMQMVVSALIVTLAIRLVVQERQAMRAGQPSVIGPNSRPA
jgi:membrane protease YdiL (CAAX protease family)